jgi:hypothetical protein
MSFNRIKYDNNQYMQDQQDSQKIGLYNYNTPIITNNCFQSNPRIMQQRNGVSLSKDVDWRFNHGPVDIESDLRNNSDPLKGDFRQKVNYNKGLTHFDDCNLPTDDTRLSNPVLRGISIDRFNPLCQNPQNNIIFPGANLISSRTLMKDNHRPLYAVPAVNSMNPNDHHDIINNTNPVYENSIKNMHH